MDRQGTQGIHDAASNGALDSEFGTHKEEEVIKQILEKGTVQETEVSLPPRSPPFLSYPVLSSSTYVAVNADFLGQNRERQGDRNITQGPTIAH